MTETRIFWVTDKSADETYEPNFSKLVQDIMSVTSQSQAEVEDLLSKLEPDESLEFVQNGTEYEVEVEVIEEIETEGDEETE